LNLLVLQQEPCRVKQHKEATIVEPATNSKTLASGWYIAEKNPVPFSKPSGFSQLMNGQHRFQ